MVRETDIRKRNTGDESISYREPGWGQETASLNISYFYLQDFSIREAALSFIGDETQFYIVDDLTFGVQGSISLYFYFWDKGFKK